MQEINKQDLVIKSCGSYLVTPEEVDKKSILPQNFLNRRSKEYNRLKEEIEILNNDL